MIKDLPVPCLDGMPPDAFDEEYSDIDLLSAAPAPFDPERIDAFRAGGD